MPRWTKEKSDEVRTELVTVLGMEGGRVALGNKTSRWFLDNVTSLKGTTTIAGILARMERDGVVVLERGKGAKPVIMGVRLPHLSGPSNGAHPAGGFTPEDEARADELAAAKADTGGREAKRVIQEAEKAVAAPAEPAAEPSNEDEDDVRGLANLLARIQFAEQRGKEAIAVAEDARAIVELLREPEETWDPSASVRVERDELARQLDKVRRDLAAKNGQIEKAVSRQRKAERQAAEAEKVAAALAKNLKTTMDLATRTGKKVRDLLAETQRREIARLMAEIPQPGTKGAK